MQKHLVWDNDVCNMYDAIRKEPSEFFPEMDTEDITDDMMWNEAYAQVEQNLGDEKANCDKDVDNHIFLMGTYVRWNGSHSVYKDLGTCNIGEALSKAIACWDGDNSFEIYVEGGRLLISQTGHDNPCNPSIMEFRVPKNYTSVDDMPKDDADYLRRHSKGLAREVREVYGWTTRRKVA